MKKVTLVIPAFNEGARLTKLVDRLHRLYPNLPLVIVDDGSIKPEKVTLKAADTLLRHKLNLGKGAALKTGIEYAFNHQADAIVMLDGDGQHDPDEVNRFIKELNNGHTVVFGSRKKTINMPFVRFVGNKFASLYIHLLFGIYVSDILSGYRAFTKEAYPFLRWQASRYGVETEMVARLGRHRHHLTWIEIPINTIYIDKYKGVTLMDALGILFQSFWWKFS